MQTDPHNALNGTAHDRYEELALRSLTEPLSFADRAALDAHLVTCEQCRAALDEWRAIRAAVKTAARKEAFSLPPLPLNRFNRKESRLMILRPLPLAAAVAATILTAFVIVASQRQIAPPGAVVTDTPMPQLAATVMPSELMRSSVPAPTSTPFPTPTLSSVLSPEETISYVVREGDTLLAILLSPPFNYAADQINSELFNRIFELNPNIQGINELPQPGIMIFIPVPPGSPYVEWQDYTVQPGDTLASILLSPPYNFSLAQITPELMDAILRLNPDMDASGELPDVGETIRIPFPPDLTTTSGDPLFMTATAVVQQATDAALGASGIDPLALTATAIIQEATATALSPAEIDPLALTATQIIQEATATAFGATVTATPLNAATLPAGWETITLAAQQYQIFGRPLQAGDYVVIYDSGTNPENLAEDEYPFASFAEGLVVSLDADGIILAMPPYHVQRLTNTVTDDFVYILAWNAAATPLPIPAGWVAASIPRDRFFTAVGVPLQVDFTVNLAASHHNPEGIGTDEYLLLPITQEARVIALDETAVTVALPAAAAEMLTQTLRDGDSIYVVVINATATPAPRPT